LMTLSMLASTVQVVGNSTGKDYCTQLLYKQSALFG
jgi:hypothetical protein